MPGSNTGLFVSIIDAGFQFRHSALSMGMPVLFSGMWSFNIHALVPVISSFRLSMEMAWFYIRHFLSLLTINAWFQYQAFAVKY